MRDHNNQAKLLALALFEIRVLLSGYLGSESDGEPVVRQAAHLAYALHNQAVAVIEGKSFDVTEAIAALYFADRVLNAGFAEKFSQVLSNDA